MQGAEAVRTRGHHSQLYEFQDFNYAGPYGDNGCLEDYTTQVPGEPTGCVVRLPATPPVRPSIWS